MTQPRYTAIVLSAGRGSRMQNDIHKQYILLNGRPVICHAIEAFEKSEVQEIVLVVGQGETKYCQTEIIDKYKYQKVAKIVEGGKERYHSVFNGLCAIEDTDYVLIHDGARPFVTPKIIERAMQIVIEEKACAAGMPVKDTIKIVDENNYVKVTPERSNVWMIQTPQIFAYDLICSAYEKMMESTAIDITDDAMVIEHYGKTKVKLFEGSYENIKITTPEDLDIAEIFCEKYEEKFK